MPKSNEFEREAEKKRHSLFAEFLQFLRENKKWWMTPILITLLLVAVLLVAGSIGAAPFIYTLF